MSYNFDEIVYRRGINSYGGPRCVASVGCRRELVGTDLFDSLWFAVHLVFAFRLPLIVNLFDFVDTEKAFTPSLGLTISGALFLNFIIFL